MSVFIAAVAKRNRKAGILAFTAVAALASTSSGAWATCGTPVQAGVLTVVNLQQLSVPASAASAAIAGAVANVDTVFLTQQGSAFVSAPGNPQPNQPGGGVWGRAIGGEVNVNTSSVSQSNFVNNNTGAVVNTATTACANNTSESFAGVQIGGDISRLNWNGWNLHLGTTAGYLGSRERDDNGFSNSFQVPFLGTYLVATHGRFFADMMVREEFYNVSLNNPGLNYFGQPVGAHGFSVSTSAGYNFDLHKGWFVEPSAGFIYSRTSVDSFINPGTTALSVPGLVSTNDIESEIGRLSLRVGRTIETPKVIWQPFASASVFHEFAGNVITNYSSLPNSVILTSAAFPGGAAPATFSQTTSTSRIGTYGQYSLGIAGQVVNTGWLGYARVDYRDGGGINGWTGNLGIRYQFTPEMIAAVMPYKVKAPPHPYLAPTNWTGFYVGGFGGAAYGRTDFQFPAAPFPIAGNRPHVFGGLGGLELGYNKQFSNNWVLGVEGDIAAANVHGGGPAGASTGLPTVDSTGHFVSTNFGFSPAFYTVQDKTNWMATVTGRLGYAWGRTLFYVKGGAAFEDSSLSASCIYGPVPPAGAPITTRYCVNTAGAVSPGWSTPSFTRVGWTGGFGTEFDLGHNWSAKTEYDFLSFGRHTALANDGVTVMTDRSWISQVKVGVNYKFTPGMVVAKY